MLRTIFVEKCSCVYLFLRWIGLTKICKKCHRDEYTCSSNNYILQFTGSGKYNNKYMCLHCLEKKIKQC